MRIERLKRRSDFGRVAQMRMSCKRPGVSVQWAPTQQSVRVGFTASKRRVSVKAVYRNRAKRRLKAWVDNYLLKIAEVCGDFVFVATESTAILPYGQLASQCEEAVKKCIQKNHILASKL